VDQYTPLPAQFRLPSTNAAYISSFVGDGFDWQSIRSGKNLYIVPNVQVEAITNAVDGAFSWRAWPSEANKPIDRKMTVDVDREYLGKVGGEGKSYMAPVSPWCEFLRSFS
jgi:glucan endo-1,3-alpha-glucosidase